MTFCSDISLPQTSAKLRRRCRKQASIGTADEGWASLDTESADLAVIDINLGNDPAFEFTRRLKATKLPFVIGTGYDQSAVPEELRSIVRPEKPFRPADLISSAASVYQAAHAAAGRCHLLRRLTTPNGILKPAADRRHGSKSNINSIPERTSAFGRRRSHPV